MKTSGKLVKKIIAVAIMIVMVFQYGLGTSYVSAKEIYDMEEFITSVKIEAEVNKVFYDVTLDNCPSVPKNANVRVRIAYNPEYIGEKKIKFNAGDEIKYKLPEGIVISNEQKGEVMDGPTVVGNYVIKTDGNIIIEIKNTEYLDATDGNLKNGTISFKGSFDSGAWGTGGDKIIDFGGETIKVPFIKDNIVEKANLTLSKTDVGNEIKWDSAKKCYYIQYNITVKANSDNTKTVKNVVVTDVFTAGEIYVDKSVIYGESVPTGTTFDKATLKWTIGDMTKGQTKTLKFKVKLTDKMTQAGSAANREIKNTAYLKADGISTDKTATTTTSAGLTIKKTNTGYDIENKTVTYTVKVQAKPENKWTLNNVKVEDLFKDNKAYVTEYVSSTPSKGDFDPDIENKKATWYIGTLAPGDSEELEYTVRISDNIFTPNNKEGTVEKILKNTATVKVNETNKGNSNSSVTFKKVWLTKTGSLQNNGKIKFTIKANASTNRMPVLDGPFEFYDALIGNKWEYDSEAGLTINWYNQGPTDKGTPVGTKVLYFDTPTDGLEVNADKTSWEWSTGTSGSPGIGNYYYEIVYYAKLKDPSTSIGSPSISNKAGIVVGIGDNDYNHEASWSGYGKTYDALRKNNESVNGEIASWKSEIICGVPKGTIYKDFRTAGEGREWYMTDKQIEDIEISYNGESIKDKTTITKEGSGFIVTFNNLEVIAATEDNPVCIYYDTTLKVDELEAAEEGTYVNKAELTIGDNTDSAQAECKYLKDHKFEKLAGEYDPVTKLMTWNLKVNNTGSMEGSAEIVDNLPEGLVFEKAEITDKGLEASENTTINSVDTDDKSVKITVNNLVKSGNKNAYVIITLTTKVVDAKVLLGVKKDTNGDGKVDGNDADNYSFTNEATLKYDNTTYSDSAVKEISNVTLTKVGTYNDETAPYINYDIEVNPNGVDMLAGAQTITVEDIMSDNLIFIQDSLEVKHLIREDEFVAYENLVVGETAEGLPCFTLEVPDDQPLKITYQAYVEGKVNSPPVDATNTVKFKGYGEYPGEKASNSITVLESNATIEGETNFYIKKSDGVIYTPLVGAEYELIEYKLNGTTIETERRTVKSDNLGTVIFKDLNEESVYGFKEVTAPNGYYIDEINKNETLVAFDENEVKAKLEAEGKEIKIIQKGTTFYRNNYKGEITVDKEFIGKIADGTYYFGLFNANDNIVTLNGKAAVAIAEVYDGQLVKEAVFRGVPFGEYAVYETDAEGNRLTTDSEGAVTVNGTKYLVSGEGTVEVSYDEPKETIEITNEYNDETSIVLEAGKILENANYQLRDGQFSFKLTGPKLDGDVVVTNDAEGKVTFPEIIYKVSDLAGASEKVFHYTISEVTPDEAKGITYSKDIYDVEVKVTNRNGELSADCKILLNGKEVTLAQFTNTYDAEGKVQFKGTKVLENANYELRDNQFGFELTGPKLGNGVVVTNDADGNIRFPEIKYELADLKGERSATFEYTVSEVNGGKTIEGVTYSDEVFNIAVTVTDNLDGTLKTEYVAKNSNGEAGEIEFVNTYDAEPDSITIVGDKEAVGFTLLEGHFGFVLVETTEGVAEDEKYTAYETNAADGTFEFELPEYYLADNGKEFTYEVREFVPEDVNKKGGVIYDRAVYTVTVKVTDNLDGTLRFEKTITKNGEIVSETIRFVNEFAGSVELTKTNGKTGNDYETLSGAVFELYKENGVTDELVGTYTTGEGGKVRAEGLVEGDYYFVEITPPAGYNIIKDEAGLPIHHKFKIGPNGGEAVADRNIKITNEQRLGELSLVKKDADTAELIEGAVFTLYKDGEAWQKGFTTNEEGIITATSLPWGEYYFVETAPAPGYVADETPTDKVVIDAEYVDDEPITVEKTNKQTEFYITKTDINGENYLTGSTVEIFKVVKEEAQSLEDNSSTGYDEEQLIPITSWTSDGSNHLIKGMLEVGETYIIKETAAPTGYGYIESYIEFTVNEDGSITSDANFAVDENGNRVLLVQDDIIDLKVTKTDYVTGKNLEGAVLAIIDKETGEEVVRWTSTKEGHYDFGAHLTANKTYILKELKAPEGYEKIDDVEFKVLNEGQVEVVTESELVTYEDGQLEIGNCPIPPEEPDTGDHTPLGMSMILMTLAMIGMVSAAMPRKRRTH